MSGPVEKAQAAWGADLPAWVEGLAKACAASSQNKVAAKLGLSAALISNVLANKYPGDLARISDLYRGAYESAEVDCPGLGRIALDACHGWRKKAKSLQNANALNVQMFRACNGCKLFLKTEGGTDDE
ncbi:hypothetical protein [Donghicola sp.]|jgi:hypothetical protein|uniref:hypothetical protein n=1 Tax=Donghicola sp. TaxID=1929294 RepID=UPI0025FAA65C|nr:hypothetical protein [Donghicola sp.]MCT4576856.1 hypothetical protein [Donghicola sp.]